MDSNTLFECRVCYRRYNHSDHKPKFLACHHHICVSCISKSLDHTVFTVKCPICREVTTVGSQDVDTALRTNADILDYMDAMEQMNNRPQPPTTVDPLANSWCNNCKEMATSACEGNGHSFEQVQDSDKESLIKAISDRRTSIKNWEEIISRRTHQGTILRSIQSTVNKLKKNIDTQINKNDDILNDMGTKLIELKNVSNIGPSSFDGVIEERRVTQSQRDLAVVETGLQRMLCLNGVSFRVVLDSDKPELSWTNGITGTLNWEQNVSEEALTHSDSLKLLGFLTLSIAPSPPSRKNILRTSQKPNILSVSLDEGAAGTPSPVVNPLHSSMRRISQIVEATLTTPQSPPLSSEIPVRPSMIAPSPAVPLSVQSRRTSASPAPTNPFFDSASGASQKINESLPKLPLEEASAAPQIKEIPHNYITLTTESKIHVGTEATATTSNSILLDYLPASYSQTTRRPTLVERSLERSFSNASGKRITQYYPRTPPPGGVKVMHADWEQHVVNLSPPPVPAPMKVDFLAGKRTSTCEWSPVEPCVLASVLEHQPVRLQSGRKFGDVKPLVGVGEAGTRDAKDQVQCLTWNVKGTVLITGSKGGYIQSWTTGAVSLYRQKLHNDGEILVLKESPKGDYIATGGSDKLVKIWRVGTQTIIQTSSFHTNAVWDIDWRSDATYASCDVDGNIFYNDIGLVNGPKLKFDGHQGWVKCLQWEPRKELLASCSTDGTIKIWSPLKQNCFHNYNFHTDAVNMVQWSRIGPDSQNLNDISYLASCSDDNTALIIDIYKGKVVHTLRSTVRPSKMVCISFSNSGNFLATANEYGVVDIWSVHNGRNVATFDNGGTKVEKIAWEKDDIKLACALRGKTCTIVDVRLSTHKK